MEETPVSSPKIPPKTSKFSLDFDVPSENPFPIQWYISNSDSKDDIQDDTNSMTVIESFPQPFHDQNTQQPSSSTVGKSQNYLVSSTMSLVYVSFLSCMSFIGSTEI